MYDGEQNQCIMETDVLVCAVFYKVLRILKMKALVEFGLSNMSKFVGKQQNISILIATKNSKSFNIRGWNRTHCNWAGALKLCSGATLRVILSSM